MNDPKEHQNMFLLETDYDGNWATIVADADIATFQVESFRSKHGFRQRPSDRAV